MQWNYKTQTPRKCEAFFRRAGRLCLPVCLCQHTLLCATIQSFYMFLFKKKVLRADLIYNSARHYKLTKVKIKLKNKTPFYMAFCSICKFIITFEVITQSSLHQNALLLHQLLFCGLFLLCAQVGSR